ncbi:MAG: DUF480 domain-containing protein [Steroidobacteraceae bacterium]
MPIELDPIEARVIGCLIEKQVTTPDQYPLSLNALVNACNQRSNRDPVMDLGEIDVQAALDALGRRQLVLERSGFGSRVPKYQHLFCNTEFGSLKFSPRGTAIVCELLLRGPQTPGELRSRASRLAPFGDVAEVEAELEALMTRPDGACVARLPREPGRREARYAHLFGGEVEAAADGPDATAQAAATGGAPPRRATGAEPGPVADHERRIAALEAEVAALRHELAALRERTPG